MADRRVEVRAESVLVDRDNGLEWPCIGHLRDPYIYLAYLAEVLLLFVFRSRVKTSVQEES
jgi:hypothetical protein